MAMKNPPSGIEPETFRFVAQHLSHGATAGPGRIELLEEKPVTLPLCTQQRPHELRGMVTSRRVTTWFSMSGSKLGGGLREGVK